MQQNPDSAADVAQRLHAVVETAVDAIITIDGSGRIESFNRAAERIFGYTAAEVQGRNVKMLMPSPYREEHDTYMQNYLRTGKKKIIGIGREVVGQRKDGTTFPLDLAVSEVPLSDRLLFTGIVRDITERKRAEEALAAERELFAVTLRSVGDGVITADMNGRVLLMSRTAEKLTGWTQDEARVRPLSEVFRLIDERTREPLPDPVRTVLESPLPAESARNALLIARDGTERKVDDLCAPLHDRDSRRIGVVIAFRDVTERHKMEQELLKTQKLESIGLLAGGIAHDFNNFLSEILINVNLSKMSLDPGSEAFSILSEAEKAAARAKDLTQQLLTFSKGGTPVKRLTTILELVRDTTRFALSGSNVRCEFDLPENLWAVEVDEGQIGQVINNLVINAVQAMPEGGTLRVRAENVRLEPDARAGIVPGRYVRLSVADRGAGIPPEHLGRIFDPYFTTKHSGTGLGLATTYSIVLKHEGHIQVESEPGSGTTFHVLLPAAVAAAPPKTGESEPLARGRGRVLLMEDSDGLRIATAKMLSRLGYEVETARDGAKALELYEKWRAAGRAFDAVIMDLTISGGMGGRETIERLLRLDPAACAIAASGYSTDPIMANFRDYGFQGVIAKPFGKKELGETLERLLGRRA